MIQYIKPSGWAWILADLKRKEGDEGAVHLGRIPLLYSSGV